jgi:cytochrome oxidase assembly protein ShyY1
MSRYRFALRPRWIISHLFVLAMVVTMVNLGMWQLNRLDERRERNDRVEARLAEDAVPVEDLVAPGDDPEAVEDLEFRPVTASGTYLVDEEVMVRARSLEGTPGSWAMTPLQLDDGTVVVVNRGWFANNGEFEAVPEDLAAPTGPVVVEGIVRLTETKGRFGSTDPDAGTLQNLARADVGRIAQQLDAEVLPVYVQLLEQEPEVGEGAPIPVPTPELDEGPHLSYAGQWFIFTTLTLIVYPLILRRRARELEKDARIAAADARDAAAGSGPMVEGSGAEAPDAASPSVR